MMNHFVVIVGYTTILLVVTALFVALFCFVAHNIDLIKNHRRVKAKNAKLFADQEVLYARIGDLEAEIVEHKAEIDDLREQLNLFDPYRGQQPRAVQ